MSSETAQPLPKFGEWDVNNPASAEGYTVIFNKARDEKKTGGNSGTPTATPKRDVGGLQADDTYHGSGFAVVECCCWSNEHSVISVGAVRKKLVLRSN
ncbi:hypothetical protein C4D60_Mb01t28380 [Musa balbisiana]|uniref:RIN4 pathogenic type III effector avirulence factor Avr cleavage site domain-containing protein n=1 Tax=Musa balbisiana TaxID=52838 RepID=A0A4S8JRD4_MUSBA|nr:hypothetical protein C4D60_Mb01t28380 [Musa balbisiana]